MKQFVKIFSEYGYSVVVQPNRVIAMALAAKLPAIARRISNISRENGSYKFYPWSSYYGLDPLIYPTDGFGIWKIHGDVRYKDSIRLGLTDYMGCAERARRLIHKGDDSLFRGKDVAYWQGRFTWLHIWFNMPIIIFGFGFGPDEVFLRWLLIERKRYCNLKGRPMEVVYVSKGSVEPQVANLITHLGGRIETVSNYAEIYG